MAIFYGALATKQNAPSGKDPVGPLEAMPVTRTLLLKYAQAGTEAAGDIVRLYKLPPGCIVIPQVSAVTSSGVSATTATITVGDYALDGTVLDADRYSTALDVQVAGADTFTGGAAAAIPFTTTVESWLTFTYATLTGTVTAATATPTGTLEFRVVVNFPR